MDNPSHKKIIPDYFIRQFQIEIETYDSLDEYFQSLLDYFSLSENPGVQENVGSYYVNQLLLADFYQEYQGLSIKFHQELHNLKQAPESQS